MSGDLRSMGLALRLASRLRRNTGLRLSDSGGDGDAELPRLRPELPEGLRLPRRGTGLRLCLQQ